MKFYPTYWQSLGLLLIWLLCTILSVLAILPFFSIESGIGLSLMYTLSMILTIGAALLIRRDYTFAFSKFSPLMIVIAIITVLSAHLFLDPLTDLVPLSDTLKKIIIDTSHHPIPFFFMIVIAAPILEELLFRGVILDGLLKNYQSWKAIGFSAFLFALVHGNLAQGIGAFVIGLLIGWIYWKTQSIIPGIIVHFLNNLIAFIGVVSTPEEEIFQPLSEQIGNPMWYWLLVIGCGLISVAGVWVLYRKYFVEEKAL
jgi:uncharacterized protein